MEENRYTYTRTLDNPMLIVTPVRLVNTISRREVVLDAIWDTGAQTSVISTLVSRSLQLPRLKKPRKHLQGIGGTVSSRAVLSVAMPGDARWATIVEADEIEHIPSGFDFVVGMDIISRGDFSLAMVNGRMRLSFTFGQQFFFIPLDSR